jgi:hypothetical protein
MMITIVIQIRLQQLKGGLLSSSWNQLLSWFDIEVLEEIAYKKKSPKVLLSGFCIIIMRNTFPIHFYAVLF